MALQASADSNKVSLRVRPDDGSGIELSHIPGNIYESLEDRDRDSHAYVTTGEAEAASTSRAKQANSKSRSDVMAKCVAFPNLKVELPIWQLAVLILFVCSMICTIAGVIVYHVIYDKIAEYVQENQSTYDTQLITVHNDMQILQQTQNTSDLASLYYRVNTDKQMTALNSAMQTTQDNQNTSDVLANEYRANNDIQLEAINNLAQEIQGKQNSSAQQVAFFAHSPSKTLVGNRSPTFKVIVKNIGGGYSKSSGQFRAPVAGLYAFSVTLFASATTRTGHQEVYCYIQKNSASVAVASTHQAPWDSTSVSIFIQLSVGGRVKLKCYNWNYIHNAIHTSFTGALIRVD